MSDSAESFNGNRQALSDRVSACLPLRNTSQDKLERGGGEL